MPTRRFRRALASLVAPLLLAGPAVVLLSEPAQAATGTATVTPSPGTNLNNPTIKTKTACSAAATEFFVVMRGGAVGHQIAGGPGEGVLIQPPTNNAGALAGLSTTGAQTQFTFEEARADSGLPAYSAGTGAGGLLGTYTLEVVCDDGLSPTDNFTADVNFTAYNAYTFVAPAPTATTTSLQATPASPQVQGTSVTLTATVSPSGAAGTVQFKDGGTAIGAPVTVAAGTASTSTSSLPVGTRSLTAVFTPADATAYAASTSSAVSYVVKAPPTATSVVLAASPASPQLVGTPVTLTATLTPSAAVGSVQFSDGGSALGAPVAVSGGKATLPTSALSVGAHALTAAFTPTDPTAYVASSSNTVNYQITSPATPTTTALAAAPGSPQQFGTSVTFTATVSPSGAAGSVQFKDGGVALGTPVTVSAGSAQYATTALAVGAHSITAVFTPADASAYAASTSTAVAYSITGIATTTTLGVAPSSPQNAGTSIQLTAALTPANASGQVAFKDGATVLGTVTVSAGSAVFNTSSLTIGSHSLSASFLPAGGTAFEASASAAQPFTVTAVPTTTVLAVNPTSLDFGTSATLTATVSPSGATGTVTFKNGAAVLGSAAVASGAASLSTSALPAGSLTLTAEFAPGTGSVYGASASSGVAVTVNVAATSVALTATPASPQPYGTPVALKATVTPSSAAGTVQFKDGGVALGAAVTVTSGVAQTTLTGLTAGSHGFTADFVPANPGYAASASTVLSFTVQTVPTAVTLTVAPTGSAAFGTARTLTATVSPSAATGTVQFKDGGSALGSPVAVGGGSAALTTPALAVGDHTLTAEFVPTSGTGWLGSTSPDTVVTVTKATTATTLTLSPAGLVVAGATVTASVTVAPATVAGSVQLLNNGSPVGAAVPVSGGAASIPLTPVAGNYSYVARFTPTDAASYLGSDSSAVTQTVAVKAKGVDAGGKTLGDNPTLKGGDVVTVSADGFGEGEQVTVTLNSTPINLGTVTASAGGTATYVLTVPADLPAGAHTLVLAGANSTAVFAFTMAAPATSGGSGSGSTGSTGSTGSSSGGGGLAATGAHVAGLAVTGLALILLGVAAVNVGRRRRSGLG